MEEHTGCKHLDYSDNYPGCELQELPTGLKFWQRKEVPYEGAPVNVQFCKLRGRINDIFSCASAVGMTCYED